MWARTEIVRLVIAPAFASATAPAFAPAFAAAFAPGVRAS
jgi:hypothetical protein